MFDKMKNKVENFGGYVFEIRDLVQDEAIIPQFCSKTVENAKRQFALFLSQNKFKPSDFRLNIIGQYGQLSEFVCNGSQVLLSDYMRDDFEAVEQAPKE